MTRLALAAVALNCSLPALAEPPETPAVGDTATRPLAASSAETAGNVEIRLLEVFFERNTTKMVLQSSGTLIPGREVFVGPKEIPATVGDLLSTSGALRYYVATHEGRAEVAQGDLVRTEATKKLSIPQIVRLSLTERITFSQKFEAAVTAVQGGRAMIDKGTLHEVHERDLYKIYDQNGRYKGLLEIRGIGDLQSSGKLYNRWEDRRRRALETRPGDRAVFVGQRRLLGLGPVGGQRFARTPLLHAFEKNYGGGLLWNVTFSNGWGLEALFGLYVREGQDSSPWKKSGLPGLDRTTINTRTARFIAPIWAKKNFFYPSLVSPFLAAGFSGFQGSNGFDIVRNGTTEIGETKRQQGLVAVLGGGIEVFPARFFRPRFDVRHFFGPRLTALGNTFYTESTFYSLGVMTAW